MLIVKVHREKQLGKVRIVISLKIGPGILRTSVENMPGGILSMSCNIVQRLPMTWHFSKGVSPKMPGTYLVHNHIYLVYQSH